MPLLCRMPVALLAVLAGIAAAPTAATAATARIDGEHLEDCCGSTFVQTLVYTAAPGERNDIAVRRDGVAMVLSDAGATITPGEGCTAVDPHQVRCTATARQIGAEGDTAVEEISFHIELGDGDDRAVLSLSRLGKFNFAEDGYIGGGAGDDILTVTKEHTVPTQLYGDAGDDTLAGSAGADAYDGGPGTDLLSYVDDTYAKPAIRRPDSVTVDLSRRGPQAKSGGASFVRVEDVTGGDGTNVLIGDDSANELNAGYRGSATGNGGNDRLTGHAVSGGAGDDVIKVASVISCGSGRDVVKPSKGRAGRDCEAVNINGTEVLTRGRVVGGSLKLRGRWAGAVWQDRDTEGEVPSDPDAMTVEIRTVATPHRLLASGRGLFSRRTGARTVTRSIRLTARGRAAFAGGRHPAVLLGGVHPGRQTCYPNEGCTDDSIEFVSIGAF